MMLEKGIKKNLLVAAGTLSLTVGVVGIFLPLLPTTPLLLLAAYCYLRSSRKLYDKLMNSKRLGPYISSYLEKKAVARRVKFSALAFLWVSLTISIILAGNLYVRLILILVGIVVSMHISSLKTIE